MSRKGHISAGGAAVYNVMDPTVPYATVARRERSRKLAQKRRDSYKSIMDDLIGVLPFPNDAIAQLDYNSRLRLALCFFRMKTMVESGEETSANRDREMRKGSSRAKQIVKNKVVPTKLKPVLFQPGMLQDLMSEALDGFMMVIQLDGTIIFLSESVNKHLGLFQSEYIGLTTYDLILEEDHEEVRKKISEAEAKSLTRTTKLGVTKMSFFCRMKCSRGKVTNTFTRSPGYKLVYVTGTLKVSKDEPFIACIVHSVSPPSILELRMEGNMFVTHYSMDMTCLFFDGRLRQLLGYRKDDLTGNTPFHLHHHEDTEATLQCSRGVMERGEGLSGYYRFLNNFGEYVWLQTRATLMYDSRTGHPSYIVCMNFIISKEDGNKDLQLRQAITSDDSSIKSDYDHAHDPFPLSEREDGKAVNPLQGIETSQLSSSDNPLESSSNSKQVEEPSSTVEGPCTNSSTKGVVISSMVDSMSSESGETSQFNSIPSVDASAEKINDTSAHLHSMSSRVSTSLRSHDSSSSLSTINSITPSSSSSSPDDYTSAPRTQEIHANQKSQAAKDSSTESSCQPDSTTVSVSMLSSQASDLQTNKMVTVSRGRSGDHGYHSESSRGSRSRASVGNESEVSGSCVQRGSPESSLYTPFSPDYPQSVFGSSDGSLPPPSNHALSHSDSPISDSHSATYAASCLCPPHPGGSQISHAMPPPVIPEPPAYQMSSVSQLGFCDTTCAPPQQFVRGHTMLGDRYLVSGLMMNSSPVTSHQGHDERQFSVNHYDNNPLRFPQQSILVRNGGGGGDSSRGDKGDVPINYLHHNQNSNKINIAFMKQEPSPSQSYYCAGPSCVSPQGTTAIFNNPHILRDQSFNKQNGSSPPVMTQTMFPQHQQNRHSVFSSGSTWCSGNTAGAGLLPSYRLANQYGQSHHRATAELPLLTGEDLTMLDAFSEQFREEEPFRSQQLPPSSRITQLH